MKIRAKPQSSKKKTSITTKGAKSTKFNSVTPGWLKRNLKHSKFKPPTV
jgi:hypothetical protein